jgi:23S rRNA (cytosine1962-C5)-methyltransferase
MGVFPEQAAHWDWIAGQIKAVRRPVRVLNLFGYTGLATLAAAQVGAEVTHVDAAKRAITQARRNQELSGLTERPIRWIVEDALKYIQREVRRGSRYDGLILDPPKFGRGAGGRVWEFFEHFPELLDTCKELLSPKPLFVVITAYAVQASALYLYHALEGRLAGLGGALTAGELVTVEQSAGRWLSQAIFARWTALG